MDAGHWALILTLGLGIVLWYIDYGASEMVLNVERSITEGMTKEVRQLRQDREAMVSLCDRQQAENNELASENRTIVEALEAIKSTVRQCDNVLDEVPY